MLEWLTELFASHPGYVYLIVAGIFVLCGLGLPLPEEIVLIAAGYVCYLDPARSFPLMMTACAAGVLAGDVLPFTMGRLFGPRLLRLRWLRMVINKERLATFDRWFRQRGDSVILVARFIPGLRVVAFFTGGTMRMRWSRFLMLDCIGIVLTTPLFVSLGYQFGDKIDDVVAWVKTAESGMLYSSLGIGSIFGVWYWLRRRAKQRQRLGNLQGAFVEQTSGEDGSSPDGASPDGSNPDERDGPDQPAVPRPKEPTLEAPELDLDEAPVEVERPPRPLEPGENGASEEPGEASGKERGDLPRSPDQALPGE